ncbi:hypothetical protein B0H19DRAFT_907692, partial [Mycena capillaripes]
GNGSGVGYPSPPVNYWQINHKLSVSIVPEWDGVGSTLIDYVSSMSNLTAMGVELANDLAQIAPSKFKGWAKHWWDSLPLEKKTANSMSSSNLLGAIRRHFLTAKWLLDCTQEFEEMQFRQKGHEREEPLDFFQRRAQHHAFVFADYADDPSTVARIIRTQPPAWDKEINEIICLDIETLQNTAEHYSSSLLASWMLTEKIAQVLNAKSSVPQQSTSTHRFRPRARQANIAEIEAQGESEEEESAGSGSSMAQSEKEAMAADKHPAKRGRPLTDWPRGRTVNGYQFTCDDSKSSAVPPNGECYICTSPKHVARDCPHYSAFVSYKQANYIQIDWDEEDETREAQEYLAMHVQSNQTSST